VKISIFSNPNFPFIPSRFPFFYGWLILIFTTVGIMASIPGQTIGVGVYIDFLIQSTSLTRMQISMSYMLGTIMSSLLLPLAGRCYDIFGSRVMIVFAGIGLGIAMLILSQSSNLIMVIQTLLPEINPAVSGVLVMTFIFLLLRQFGQGIMAMVSMNTLAKWFDRHRGFVSGISGIFVSFSFAGAPLFMNVLIEEYSYTASMFLLALICGLGMALIGWTFYRDKPEDCGMLMDGKKIDADEKTNLSEEREITLKAALRTYNFWIFCLGLCSLSLIITGFTFHISSIGALAGLSRMDAFGMFLPMSVISAVSHLISGWASDRMPLKYLLMILLVSLGMGCLGILHLESIWFRMLVISGFGISGGLYACLIIVVWPRFYGRKHLGSINGLFMGAQVFASAIGPPVFGISENLTGNYSTSAWISAVLCLVLLLSSFRTVSYYRPLSS